MEEGGRILSFLHPSCPLGYLDIQLIQISELQSLS
jgi:hypothetical protein